MNYKKQNLNLSGKDSNNKIEAKLLKSKLSDEEFLVILDRFRFDEYESLNMDFGDICISYKAYKN